MPGPKSWKKTEMGRVAKDPRDGKWLARWRDPSGKQGKKSFRRKIDAERFLNEMMSQINRGMYVDPAAGKIAFGAYAETWATGLAHLKETTASRYRDVLRTHVLPKWGDWRLGKIAHSDVAIWVSELRKHLAAGSVRKVYLVLAMILESAVQDGRLGRNPAKGVRLPRQIRREPRFLSRSELERLTAAAGDNGLALLVLALTGLRFGEFAALRVRSLDLDRRRLIVSEGVTFVESKPVWSTPKNHKTRSVPVPPSLFPYLLAQVQGRGRDEVLFPAPMGGPIRLNNWRRRVFDPACERAGLTGVTPHDLRHTAASLSVGAGANVKAVQQMLGHASAAMTLDIYAGLFPDDLDAVALRLDVFVPQTCHNGRFEALAALGESGPDGADLR